MAMAGLDIDESALVKPEDGEIDFRTVRLLYDGEYLEDDKPLNIDHGTVYLVPHDSIVIKVVQCKEFGQSQEMICRLVDYTGVRSTSHRNACCVYEL